MPCSPRIRRGRWQTDSSALFRRGVGQSQYSLLTDEELYSARVNFVTKVLDFVQLGGPVLTVEQDHFRACNAIFSNEKCPGYNKNPPEPIPRCQEVQTWPIQQRNPYYRAFRKLATPQRQPLDLSGRGVSHFCWLPTSRTFTLRLVSGIVVRTDPSPLTCPPLVMLISSENAPVSLRAPAINICRVPLAQAPPIFILHAARVYRHVWLLLVASTQGRPACRLVP